MRMNQDSLEIVQRVEHDAADRMTRDLAAMEEVVMTD